MIGRYKLFAVGLASLSILSGCASDSADSSISYPKAINTRPTEVPPSTLRVVLLKSKTLLDTSMKLDGNLEIDEETKKQILEEQEAVEKKLKEISEDIHVIYRYRFLLNGLAISVPEKHLDAIKGISEVAEVRSDSAFTRPIVQKDILIDTYRQSIAMVAEKENTETGPSWGERTSVDFIGATEAHDIFALDLGEQGTKPLKGQGIKIGVLDTGIDYTHKMFGGEGTEEAYKANDPGVVEEGSFPTQKVKGIDLVGTNYHADSKVFENRIPIPDDDPIDEATHGTHVAGTVGGLGDGKQTYDGVAPLSDLYAIKVFGKDGSTGDAVVIAGLEYAMDPNGDLNPSDKLDVVNLSLGSPFGIPHNLYNRAIKNLTEKGEVVAVMSAGNSGDIPYIVGSPGVSDSSIQVAASVDEMDQNWKFAAVAIESASLQRKIIKAIESTMTEEVGLDDIAGKLVFAGLADEDFDEELAAKVSGNIALIDRGKVTFAEKIKRAFEAGATGIVVVNNNDGDPIAMGGDGEFKQGPAIMITKALGDQIKKELNKGLKVTVDFQIDERIEEPELIDTITGFSSRGPRSLDAHFKPEISAPGALIVSAEAGTGLKGSMKSGTSMAAPHMAGVMGLMRQKFPTYSPKILKAMVLSSTTSISDKDNNEYPIARQGMGRVQVKEALATDFIATPAAISLGEHSISSTKKIARSIEIHNLSEEKQTLKLAIESSSEELAIEPLETSFELESQKSVSTKLLFRLLAPKTLSSGKELEAVLSLENETGKKSYLKVLGVLNSNGDIKASELTVFAGDALEADGAIAELTLTNYSDVAGEAYPFQLVSKDDQKPGLGRFGRIANICDLESFGFKTIEKEVDGNKIWVAQFAAKLFHPITNWNHCEISIQIDSNEDGIADQELLGLDANLLVPGAPRGSFQTLLADAEMLRKLRVEYETTELDQEDYSKAILSTGEFKGFAHSSIAILEIPLNDLRLTESGFLNIKVASLVSSQVVANSDDFLADHFSSYFKLDMVPVAQTVIDLPDFWSLESNSQLKESLTIGSYRAPLLVLMPFNKSRKYIFGADQQAQIVKPKFN